MSKSGNPAGLAGLLAHELNNIAVPLQGFADLANLAAVNADESVIQCLAEVRIGVARIALLSRQLDRLAQPAASPRAIGIAECINLGAGQGFSVECDPATRITADGPRIRDAVDSLREMTSDPVVLSVIRGVESAERCASCDAMLSPESGWLRIRLHAARIPGVDAIRNPFGAGHAIRPGRRLALAALVHCSHTANGHVVARPSEGDLSIAVPLAPG